MVGTFETPSQVQMITNITTTSICSGGGLEMYDSKQTDSTLIEKPLIQKSSVEKHIFAAKNRLSELSWSEDLTDVGPLTRFEDLIRGFACGKCRLTARNCS
jgi:hypothetical protein